MNYPNLKRDSSVGCSHKAAKQSPRAQVVFFLLYRKPSQPWASRTISQWLLVGQGSRKELSISLVSLPCLWHTTNCTSFSASTPSFRRYHVSMICRLYSSVCLVIDFANFLSSLPIHHRLLSFITLFNGQSINYMEIKSKLCSKYRVFEYSIKTIFSLSRQDLLMSAFPVLWLNKDTI